MQNDNQVVIEAWNTVLFEKFTRFRHLLTAGLSSHSDELLRRYSPRLGERLLDVGCGFGDMTLELARRVGEEGAATGVDCASNFVESARGDAASAGITNADYFVADVQHEPLHGPYTGAYARFGTMFFNSPGAALRNIRRALAPGAVLRAIVWRKREDNPWLYEAERRVRDLVPVVSHEETEEVHCGPGPFSMASADRVSELLLASGYGQVTFERFDSDICIGRDLNEAVAFAKALGPAGEILRLAGDASHALSGQVEHALREAFIPFARRGAVWAPSSTWFVSATNVTAAGPTFAARKHLGS